MPPGRPRPLTTCRALSVGAERIVSIEPGLPWPEVPVWLANAVTVIAPSMTETFGLPAPEHPASASCEVMNRGTWPYDIDRTADVPPGSSTSWRTRTHMRS